MSDVGNPSLNAPHRRKRTTLFWSVLLNSVTIRRSGSSCTQFSEVTHPCDGRKNEANVYFVRSLFIWGNSRTQKNLAKLCEAFAEHAITRFVIAGELT